jgi:multidrug resistance efflux pump
MTDAADATLNHAPPAPGSSLADRVHQLRLGSSDAPRSRGGISWLPWVLALLLAGSWAFYAITFVKSKSPPPPSVPVPKAPAGGDVAGSGDIALALKGNLIPATQIAVSPIDVAGRVIDLRIVEGQSFKKGDLLAKIEDVSYQSAKAEAEAMAANAQSKLESAKERYAELDPKSVRKIELDQAEAQLNEAIANQKQKKFELDQYISLRAGNSAISSRELQQAENDMAAASARVEQLRAALAILKEGPRPEKLKSALADVKAAEKEFEAANARLVQAAWRLNNCVITAPVDGVVLQKKAELFNLVNPLAFAATSGSLCDIADLSDMEVELDVPERDIGKVIPGQKCHIRPDAFEKLRYDGTVDRIMPIADDSKSVIKIRVKVILPKGEVPGSLLKPKMSVVVELLKGEAEKKNSSQ